MSSATANPRAAAGTATWRPALPRPLAMALAAAEYQRLSAHLQSLNAADWGRPTCCPAWDVRLMVCHVAGMAEFAASPVERIRQLRKATAAAKSSGRPFIDELTALQSARHSHRSTGELLAFLRDAGPRAARGRRRTPALVRGMRMTSHADAAGRHVERWTLGYLLDVVLTRDTWMHRSDIAEATGHPMQLTAGHDGVLVADVAGEWARRHGEPCRLTLTGPAGGQWEWGAGGVQHELDAVQFCRILAGRGTGEGLLATPVPF